MLVAPTSSAIMEPNCRIITPTVYLDEPTIIICTTDGNMDKFAFSNEFFALHLDINLQLTHQMRSTNPPCAAMAAFTLLANCTASSPSYTRTIKENRLRKGGKTTPVDIINNLRM